MVDAEHTSGRISVEEQATNLGVEIASASVPHDRVAAKSMNLRQTDAHREAVQLRFSPRDGEGDGCVSERVEVERVVGVLPEVVGVHHQIPPKRLLETGVKLVASARS